MSITNLILALAAAAIGGGIGYFFRKQIAQTRANTVEAIAEKKLIEAKNKEQELLLQAKEKAIKIIDDAKKEEEDRRNELRQIQSRLEQRENMFDKKITEFEDEKTKVQQEKEQTKALREKIQEIQQEALKKLQTISGLSMDDAKNVLLKKVEEESKNDLMARIIKFEKDNHEELEARAQDIMVCCMQRTASSHAAETTSTVINLASDDMKGRIIGKEGRNIKTLEKLTGCELIIDETPDILLVSSFSPIRRRVCQLALEKLMKDGRIQPAKIEEYVEEAKKELALDLKKAGEEALHKMGIVGMDPKLVSIIGRLKYRTSYGQNVLMHCMEVGTLAALMAEEVGMDPGKARKAGFFHDIGKSVDHDTQGTHTQIGHTILKKFGVGDEIAEVALTHHDTNPPLLLTKLVMAADAISASRVGARRDTFEQYVARLEELEAVAKDFPGVDKVYAIQAGREVRVFVNPNEADDYQAYNMAKDIARKIESELQYPGEIKVNVIRETRAIEYAR
jgi:ribonuclease Y